jgi:hypothetical protein
MSLNAKGVPGQVRRQADAVHPAQGRADCRFRPEEGRGRPRVDHDRRASAGPVPVLRR